MTPSCALFGGFAIGARVALLWQHNANAKCQRVHACTRSMPSFNFYIASGRVQSILMSVFACLSVTLYMSVCPLTYLIKHTSQLHTIVCTS